MKMYVLVRENIPIGLAITAACHASVACNNRFRNTAEIQQWLDGTFYKVVCKVNDKEFENAKAVEDCVVVTESALGGIETAIAFKPREEYSKMFKFLRLYK